MGGQHRPFLPSCLDHTWAVGPGDGADHRFGVTAHLFAGFDQLVERFPEVRAVDQVAWQRLDSYVSQARGDAADHIDTLRRRLNREPGASIRAVELGAELLITGLAALGNQHVHLADVDMTDTLTFRLLARAAARAGRGNRVTFRWSTASSPLESAADPVIAARKALQARVADTGLFSLHLDQAQHAPAAFPAPTTTSSEADVLRSLTNHNYDAALHRLSDAIQVDESRHNRLLAITHIAIGNYDLAGRLLRDAIDSPSSDVLHQAHLHCLLGLLETKRYGQLDAADNTLRLGLSLLETAPDDDRSRVERAWLLNGRALIAALASARGTDVTRMAAAYQLTHEALLLIKDSAGDEAAYLRYNLVANLIVLHQMRGAWDTALETLQRSFNNAPKAAQDTRAVAVFEYRVGALALRAGSDGWTPPGPRLSLDLEDWHVDDYLTRLTGLWHLRRGEHTQAKTAFAKGLQIAEDGRSKATLDFHLEALAAISDEPAETHLIQRLPTKLPTNNAEIDFDFEPRARVAEKLQGRAP